MDIFIINKEMLQWPDSVLGNNKPWFLICQMTKCSTQEIRWKFTSFSLLQVSQPSDDWCLPKLYTKSIPAHSNTIRVHQTNQSVNPVNGNNFYLL
jgi:hypothetical protein